MAAAEGANVRRAAAVLLLAALSIALWAPDLRRIFGHPLGVTGLVTSPYMRVVGVLHDSPAARAGMHPGPYVDLSLMSPQDRLTVGMDQGTRDPGQHVRVWLQDGARTYSRDLITVAEDSKDIPTVAIRALLGLSFLFAGIILVLRRPSVATWAFFILTLGSGAAINVSTMSGPAWWQAVMDVVFECSVSLPAFAGAIFAVYLLHEGSVPRWRRVLTAVIGVIVLVDIALIVWGIWGLFTGRVATFASIITAVLYSLAFFSVPFILLATYVESVPAVRQRLRWVIAGFTIAAVARTIDAFLYFGFTPLQLPYFSHAILIAVSISAISFSVVYAVLKHRILDVNVAFSRALVYTVLSAIIIGLFALVDLFFSRALSHSNAGYIADIALALVLGFSFNTMHHHVDRIVDGLFFRSRHLAERHLATVLSAIPYAKSEENVTELITQDPVRTLDLSGALIARTEHMNFDGAASLVAYLEGTRTALRPLDHGRLKIHLGFEPALAAPVFCHGDLVAVVFYGYHVNHTDLDADEVALLERIASAAGAAYDHLEAQALRREVAALRAQLESRAAHL